MDSKHYYVLVNMNINDDGGGDDKNAADDNYAEEN